MNDGLQGIDHKKLKRFLQSEGWTKKEDIVPGIAEQYVKGTKSIDLVTESNMPNYSQYLQDSIRSLSVLESKPIDDIFKAITTTGNSVLSVKIDSKSYRHRIRMSDSSLLRNSIEQMVLAASHSVISPLITHPALSKREAKDFLQACFEDQTEKSSYVANFLIPKREIESLSGEDVIEKIRDGIATAKEIAEKEVLPSASEYEALARKGISSNFVLALSNLKGISDSENIQFSFDKHSTIELNNEDFSNLNDFYGEIVKPTTAVKTLRGSVVARTLEPDVTITIEGNVEGQLRKIKIKISADDYRKVSDEEHRLISSTGTIELKPQVKVTGILRARSRGRYEVVEIQPILILKTEYSL